MSGIKDHVNFLGYPLPPGVSLLVKSLKKYDISVFERLVTVAVEMSSDTNPTNHKFSNLTKGISKEAINHIYPGVFTIIRKAMRTPKNLLKKNVFENDLNEIMLPTSFHAPLSTALFGDARPSLEDNAHQQCPHVATLSKLRWRVDVAISNASLNRVMEPTILITITTDKGEEHTLEVSKEKFHQLRYSVLEVLNYMQQLEKRSIFQVET
nr:COMM domain-containing protein 5 [Ciona intestinalis]|eukprot:XP_002131181.1 COMM domain-containing protein 5 [Ciona intestinalis]